ncbi:MAG: hypothetical protein Q4E73_03050 [Lachnospiraceae bacterium]|nr:hypothetical protein [Lachnospiraceae bacterium]
MKMNPMQLMKIKKMWDEFTARHPKFPMFLKDVLQRGIQENTVLEMKVISPEGKESVTNIKIRKEDMELFRELQKMRK